MTDSMTFVTIFVFGLFVGVGILFLMAKLTECFSRAIELYIKKQKTYESKIKYRQETQKPSRYSLYWKEINRKDQLTFMTVKKFAIVDSLVSMNGGFAQGVGND